MFFCSLVHSLQLVFKDSLLANENEKSYDTCLKILYPDVWIRIVIVQKIGFGMYLYLYFWIRIRITAFTSRIGIG